jgi:superfamily II DNA or RNA helicase
VTLARRVALIGDPNLLGGFDFAIFDEIDTYLTLEDNDERRDIWPALQRCIDADLPVIGFTGTNLDHDQEAAWLSNGFERVEAEVPHDWLPFTRVRFVAVHDQAVSSADGAIREELRAAYRLLDDSYGEVSWSQLKRLAAQGEAAALRILELCYQRLELFESLGTDDGKLREIEQVASEPAPSLILSRFRHSARTLAGRLRDAGLRAAQADGGMERSQIERTTRAFRFTPTDEQLALIITRELGGRGLDFPNAGAAVLVSPRSNYQAVAQELARVRSRQKQTKEATVLYYSNTEEEAKARRLGEHLRGERFGNEALFEVTDLPGRFPLERFESVNLRHEESLDYRTLTRLGSIPLTVRE